MSKPEMSVIVPAFNEQEIIEKTLGEIRDILQKHSISYECIVVDDASSDATAARVKTFLQNNVYFQLISIDHNRGMGHAFITGVKAARGQWITLLPGDNQILPQTIIDMHPYMHPKKIVIGRRKNYHQNLIRRVLSFSHLIVPKFFFRVDIHHTCGCNIYPFDLFKHIHVAEKSFWMSAEILTKAHYLGYKFVAVDVKLRERTYGRSNMIKPQVIIRNIFGLWQLILIICRFRRQLRACYKTKID